MSWRHRSGARLLLSLLLAVMTAPAPAGDAQPAITIIIDDIGNRLNSDSRAIALPGPISYAVLPHTPYAGRMARLAHRLDKDVLVHLPMEAGIADHLLGPGALRRDMSAGEFSTTVRAGIAAVPHAVGISNHMGSVLTGDSHAMQQLMRLLQPTGLFYLDSYTNADSVAGESAARHRVPYLRRDVFLDNDRDPDAIRHQFARLLTLARERGRAIAIGHPHPETLAVLGELLPQLNLLGVRLVGIRAMLNQEAEPWQQLSSSR